MKNVGFLRFILSSQQHHLTLRPIFCIFHRREAELTRLYSCSQQNETFKINHSHYRSKSSWLSSQTLSKLRQLINNPQVVSDTKDPPISTTLSGDTNTVDILDADLGTVFHDGSSIANCNGTICGPSVGSHRAADVTDAAAMFWIKPKKRSVNNRDYLYLNPANSNPVKPRSLYIRNDHLLTFGPSRRPVISFVPSRNFSTKPDGDPVPVQGKIVKIPNPLGWIKEKMYLFIIRRYVDSKFSFSEFTDGAKQAVIVILKHLAAEDFDSLGDLLERQVVDQIKESTKGCCPEDWHSLLFDLKDVKFTSVNVAEMLALEGEKYRLTLGLVLVGFRTTPHQAILLEVTTHMSHEEILHGAMKSGALAT